MNGIPLPHGLPLDSASSMVDANKATEEALRNSPAGRKLFKATREFEADLITSWWQEAEKDLQEPGSGGLGSGFDGLKNVAMTSLAENMVQAGGLGIARMIFHSLEPALQRKLQPQDKTEEVH